MCYFCCNTHAREMTCYNPHLLRSPQGKGRQSRCPLASKWRCLQGKLSLRSYPCAQRQVGQAGPEDIQSTQIRLFLWIAICPPKSLCLSACWYIWTLEITGTQARVPKGELRLSCQPCGEMASRPGPSPPFWTYLPRASIALSSPVQEAIIWDGQKG